MESILVERYVDVQFAILEPFTTVTYLIKEKNPYDTKIVYAGRVDVKDLAEMIFPEEE